jgi:ketosteroid isomerase-like protein
MARPEEIALRMLELTDRQDWAAREALLSPDCDVLTPAGRLWGRAATTAYSKPLVSAFGDARHQVDLVATAGDVVVLEGTWIATHTGPLATPGGEVPPTGRTINLPFAATMRVDGEHVASMHVYFDQLAFLGQLGLAPQSQAA